MGLCRPFPQQTFGAQVIRAHDVRQFAFSVNWVRPCESATHPILWVLGISSPFSLPLPHYMSFRPSQFCSCGVPSVHGLSGPAGLPLLRVSSSQFSVVECGGFCGLPMFPYMCFTMYPVPSLLLLSVHIVCNCFTVHM